MFSVWVPWVACIEGYKNDPIRSSAGTSSFEAPVRFAHELKVVQLLRA